VTINHGTRSGYYAHRRLSETPCEACREAINEYVKEYRAKNGLARNRAGEKIRRKALAVLRDRHRDEYEELVEEFRVAEEASVL
jgi:cytidine deaminase